LGPSPEREPGAFHRDPTFWRKRLARGLVAVGVALIAVRFLPHLPEEHAVLFHAPEGNQLVDLQLNYYDTDGHLLVGAQIRPTPPSGTVAHTLRVPAGEVRVDVTATIATGGGHQQELLEQRRLQLDGSTQKVFLRAPKERKHAAAEESADPNVGDSPN
jgi:hypothetical protein